jgi:hypothetical protein
VEKETTMHRHRTDRLVRHIVIFGLLVTGAVIGTLSAGPANAATRHGGDDAQLATGSGSQALVAPDSVLVDLTDLEP